MPAKSSAAKEASSPKELAGWIPQRKPDSHKGDFGHALIVAGSRGMTGAAMLAARAALRAGAGLVTLALPESQQRVVAAGLVEALTLSVPETTSGSLSPDALSRIHLAHQQWGYTVMAIGPGLSVHPETAKGALSLMLELKLPTVIDADALNILARQPPEIMKQILSRLEAPCIVTPHPGEMARLLQSTVPDVQKDRAAAAKRFASRYQAVCLLKGRETVITDGTRIYVNKTGNPGLAKGGSGDALTGVIAALWAQRLSADPKDKGFEAAAAGCYLHGSAADIAVKTKTVYSLLASDVIEALPDAFQALGLR